VVVFDLVEKCLAPLRQDSEEMYAKIVEEIADSLAGTSTTIFDYVNLARVYTPEFEEAVRRSEALNGVGAVHLELGTGQAFPPERLATLKRQGGLSEFIRLDLDPRCMPDIVADCSALPFLDESVDRIASNSLFEHIAFPREAIEESFRVLRPGGSMRITAPFHFALHGCPQDYLRYTPEYFLRICEETGFEKTVCETHAFGGLYYTLHQSSKGAIVGGDLAPGLADGMRTLHMAVMLLLATLMPLDRYFVGEARQFFHTVSCLAFKAGTLGSRERARGEESSSLDRTLDLMACPISKTALRRVRDRLICDDCGAQFPIRDGIPVFTEPDLGGFIHRRARKRHSQG
jgi:uncharacterized protein YbaR (Trm112 family)/SAM-dependent methyltransferase